MMDTVADKMANDSKSNSKLFYYLLAALVAGAIGMAMFTEMTKEANISVTEDGIITRYFTPDVDSLFVYADSTKRVLRAKKYFYHPGMYESAPPDSTLLVQYTKWRKSDSPPIEDKK